MNAIRFDELELFRSLASGSSRSRRGVLGGLTSGLLAALPLALGGEDTQAKNKKKGKKKKKKTSQPQPVVNAFGCVDVGQACRGDSSLCCSGICDGSAPAQGKPDTSVCVAHNAGICFADSNSCAVGGGVSCNPSKPSCICMLTTGNAGFCGDLSANDPADMCRFCSADTDCQAEFGPGAACVVLGGVCTPYCPATGRTACMAACA